MKAFIYFIFVVALVGLGMLVGKGGPQTTSSRSPEPTQSETAITPDTEPSAATTASIAAPSPSPAAQGGTISGTLFTYKQANGISEIEAITIETKKKRSVYTDKGKSTKLKSVSHLTADGQSVIATIGESDGASDQLVAIKTDGSGQQTVLVDNFVSTQAPVVSPDGTRLALVSFSNAEPDFGFTLVVTDINGKNRKELTKDQSGIAQLHFSADGSQLAYLKGAAATQTEVERVTIANGQTSGLYKAKDKIITDFDWSSLGLLAVTMAPNAKTAATQSDLYLVDPKNSSAQQLTKTTTAERYPVLAPDGSGLAFIKTTGQSQNGEVTVVDSQGKELMTLGSAQSVVGWSK